MKPQRRIPLQASLKDSPEEGIGVEIPAVLSDRLDGLVHLAERAGERTSRKELIAALIRQASADPDELVRTLRRYRRATVSDALLRRQVTGKTVTVSSRRPGPRRRKPA